MRTHKHPIRIKGQWRTRVFSLPCTICGAGVDEDLLGEMIARAAVPE